MVEIILRVHMKRKKGLNDFKFGTFIGRFANDCVASVAVKGLRRSGFSATDNKLLLKTKRQKKTGE